MPTSPSLANAALDLMNKGFAVVPIPKAGYTYKDKDGNQREASGKGPIIGGWQKTRLTKEFVYQALISNNGTYVAIGVVSGAISGNLVLLDFDGAGWEVAAEAFFAAWPESERAPQVRTGSGKLHVWLWCDDLPRVFTRKAFGRSDLGDKTAIELRGNECQALCPPSLHPSGGTYQWITTEADRVHVKFVDLYNWLAEWAGDAQYQAGNVEKPLAEPLPDVIRAGGRHTAMVSLAGSLRRRGVGESTILVTLTEENRLRCDPPLADDELVSIAHSMGGYPATEPLSGAAEPINLTDLGNARRLARRHGENIRFCHTWGKWMLWKGTHWYKDETSEVQRLAMVVVAEMYAEASGLDTDARKALASWALRSESRGRLEAMATLAQDLPGMPVLQDQLDREPMQLNVLNGTIDLYTGALRDHQRGDLLTKIVPAAYHKDATCPTWDAFLWRIMDGNETLIHFLRRAAGYTLTGLTTEQCLFFLYGTGANGKSTFVETLAALFGDYYQKAPTSMLMMKSHDGIPNDLARLPGARFVVAAEVEEGRRMAESLVKDLTGDDTIPARFLHQEYFQFKPTHKLWMYGNHKPVIRGTDEAIWRRIRLIPFAVTIPEAERDKGLPDALRTELDGILAWAVRGCQEWQRDGLGVPDEVKQATQKYRAEMDALGEFIEDSCLVGPGFTAQAAALYQAYTAWCKDIGEAPMSATLLGRALRERGYQKSHTRQGATYSGIGVIGQTTQAMRE